MHHTQPSPTVEALTCNPDTNLTFLLTGLKARDQDVATWQQTAAQGGTQALCDEGRCPTGIAQLQISANGPWPDTTLTSRRGGASAAEKIRVDTGRAKGYLLTMRWKFHSSFITLMGSMFLVASTALAQDGAGVQSSDQEASSIGTPQISLATKNASEQLSGYIQKYIDADFAADYLYYLETDMSILSFSDLRIQDALAIMKMYDDAGVLVEWEFDAELIVWSVIAWFASPETGWGAAAMSDAIAVLHDISPDTTKEALSYTANIFWNIPGEISFTPWGTAVRVASEYGVDYAPGSRSTDLEDVDNPIELAKLQE